MARSLAAVEAGEAAAFGSESPVWSEEEVLNDSSRKRHCPFNDNRFQIVMNVCTNPSTALVIDSDTRDVFVKSRYFLLKIGVAKQGWSKGLALKPAKMTINGRSHKGGQMFAESMERQRALAQVGFVAVNLSFTLTHDEAQWLNTRARVTGKREAHITLARVGCAGSVVNDDRARLIYPDSARITIYTDKDGSIVCSDPPVIESSPPGDLAVVAHAAAALAMHSNSVCDVKGIYAIYSFVIGDETREIQTTPHDVTSILSSSYGGIAELWTAAADTLATISLV